MQKRETEEIACSGIIISYEEDGVDKGLNNVNTMEQRADTLTKAPITIKLSRYAELLKVKNLKLSEVENVSQ